MSSRLGIVAAVLGVLLLWVFWPASGRRYPPGILVPDSPVTTLIEQGKPWSWQHYLITPLATYQLSGRVLSKARYYMGRECDLSTYDLAIGWGHMSDQSVIDQLSIGQGSRWYTYTWPANPPTSPYDMATQSKNMHIIAANDAVLQVLKTLHTGDLIKLTGQLIEARAPDGWSWKSCLNDSQTGPASCKVIWTEKLSPDNRY